MMDVRRQQRVSSDQCIFVLWSHNTDVWTSHSASDGVVDHCQRVCDELMSVDCRSLSASADCTALSVDYIWPSGFLCGRPDSLELTTDRVS